MLLRLDPQVYDALARWARDDLRSVNAQVEMLLRRALTDAGRAPTGATPIPRRGRPRQQADPSPADQNTPVHPAPPPEPLGARTPHRDTEAPDVDGANPITQGPRRT